MATEHTVNKAACGISPPPAELPIHSFAKKASTKISNPTSLTNCDRSSPQPQQQLSHLILFHGNLELLDSFSELLQLVFRKHVVREKSAGQNKCSVFHIGLVVESTMQSYSLDYRCDCLNSQIQCRPWIQECWGSVIAGQSNVKGEPALVKPENHVVLGRVIRQATASGQLHPWADCRLTKHVAKQPLGGKQYNDMMPTGEPSLGGGQFWFSGYQQHGKAQPNR